MRKTDDAMARARHALSQVDAELDLTRTHAEALARARSRPEPFNGANDDAAHGVEILRHGQRPSQPRHRATVWALAATIALVGGAGLGTAMLWQGPGETVPGTPGPGLATYEPDTDQTLDPRECVSPPPVNPPAPTPAPGPSGQTGRSLQSPDGCETVPSAAPSAAPSITPGPTETRP